MSVAPSAQELAQFLVHAFRLLFLGEMPALGDRDATHVARHTLPDLQDIEGFADELEVGAPHRQHGTVDQIVLILDVLLQIDRPRAIVVERAP